MPFLSSLYVYPGPKLFLCPSAIQDPTHGPSVRCSYTYHILIEKQKRYLTNSVHFIYSHILSAPWLRLFVLLCGIRALGAELLQPSGDVTLLFQCDGSCTLFSLVGLWSPGAGNFEKYLERGKAFEKIRIVIGDSNHGRPQQT